MPSSGSAERRDPDGLSVRLGYTLRRQGIEKHDGIVTKVCLERGGSKGEPSSVFTSSRDGTIKYWDVPAEVDETYGGATSSAAVPRFRASLEEHGGWVNDLIVLPSSNSSSKRLVSASNDNLVKVWQVEEDWPPAAAGSLMSLRYHIDYVTSLAYSPRRNLLASAGLDSRAVVADLEAASRVLTLHGEEGHGSGGHSHRSSPGSSGRNIGGGHACTVGQFSGAGQYIPMLLVPNPQAAKESAHDQNQDGHAATGASLWSLAMNHNASLLVCGTASCTVRGWDPRSGQRLWRLKGHTENVRALAINEDGTLCVSAAGDRSVRLWDLGMRRCIHKFDVHQDSVWALAVAGYSCGYASQGVDTSAAGGAFSTVFSAGRDGFVFRHDLRQLQSAAVVQEASPVQALAVGPMSNEVWLAAADSHVRRRPVSGAMAPYSCSSPSTSPFLSSPTAASTEAGSDRSIAIEGCPRLTDFKVLDNKQQVLVKDACGHFALCDVTTGQHAEFNPPADTLEVHEPSSAKGAEEVMKRVFAFVNRPMSVPSWFSCNIALGGLSVYLDTAQCFKAEVDEADLVVGPPPTGSGRKDGSAGFSADRGVNLGMRTLHGLFDTWVNQQIHTNGGVSLQHQFSGSGSGSRPIDRSGSTGTDRGSFKGQSPSLRRSSVTGKVRLFVPLAPHRLQHPRDAGGSRDLTNLQNREIPGTTSSGSGPTGLMGGVASSSSSSSSSTFPPATAIVCVSRSGRLVGFRGRLYCGYFSSQESPDLLPPWVVDVVWGNRAPPEELCGQRFLPFSLLRSSVEQNLPSLPNALCTATPRTRIRKVMLYLVRNLDFDWNSPVKPQVRRPSSAVSLVSRLGRCCVAPNAARGRSGSDDWGHSSRDSPHGSGPGRVEGGSRNRDRSHSAGGGGNSAGGRRHFGLRRNEEDGNAGGGSGRVRVDLSPSTALSDARNQCSENSYGDEQHVEVLCHGAPVPPEMSLATVRDHVWKNPGAEMILTYRIAAAPKILAAPPAPPTGSKSSEDALTDVVASEYGGEGAIEAARMHSPNGAPKE